MDPDHPIPLVLTDQPVNDQLATTSPDVSYVAFVPISPCLTCTGCGFVIDRRSWRQREREVVTLRCKRPNAGICLVAAAHRSQLGSMSTSYELRATSYPHGSVGMRAVASVEQLLFSDLGVVLSQCGMAKPRPSSAVAFELTTPPHYSHCSLHWDHKSHACEGSFRTSVRNHSRYPFRFRKAQS